MSPLGSALLVMGTALFPSPSPLPKHSAESPFVMGRAPHAIQALRCAISSCCWRPLCPTTTLLGYGQRPLTPPCCCWGHCCAPLLPLPTKDSDPSMPPSRCAPLFPLLSENRDFPLITSGPGTPLSHPQAGVTVTVQDTLSGSPLCPGASSTEPQTLQNRVGTLTGDQRP